MNPNAVPPQVSTLALLHLSREEAIDRLVADSISMAQETPANLAPIFRHGLRGFDAWSDAELAEELLKRELIDDGF